MFALSSCFCSTIFNIWSNSNFNITHKYVEVQLADNKSSSKKSVAIMSFQNSLQMWTTCQHCSAATLWPPCPSAASLCAHTLTDTYFNLIPTTAHRKTLGDWHPPHLPPVHPILLCSIHSHWPPQRRTIVYFHSPSRPCWSGGPGRIVTLLSGPPLHPLPSQPGLTPFTDLKSTICMTQQSGSKGERDGARRGMKTRRGERRWRLRTEERELEREREASQRVQHWQS